LFVARCPAFDEGWADVVNADRTADGRVELSARFQDIHGGVIVTWGPFHLEPTGTESSIMLSISGVSLTVNFSAT
jgi:hypothetical protein